MMYSNIASARSVVYHCKQRQLENIVISPGSRNAPLILGFTEDPFFKCHSIVDERSAAFFALGIAQQKRKPVVLVCTSGSALLNYYPAVAEAFYSDIPLVVVSADRPDYKIDIGDGQTIRQPGVLEQHIGFSANLKLDLNHSVDELKNWGVLSQDADGSEIKTLQERVQKHNDLQLNQALQKAMTENYPVHINVPFEEPLYGLQEGLDYVPQVITPDKEKDHLGPIQLKELANIWNQCNRKLILSGVQYPDSLDQRILDEFAQDPSVVVLTETTSNLHHPDFINSIDSVLAPVELAENREELFNQLRPDLVITLGGLIVSKKVKAFLRTWSPSHHWHIHENKAPDIFRVLSEHIKIDPNLFFKEFLKITQSPESDYNKHWHQAKNAYIEQRESYLNQIAFSDFSAFNEIFKALPAAYQLQLANSSAVRYSQLFKLDPKTNVFCNRGTSGIDGSTSTAVGAALYSDRPTLLISGDLSFLYDINGLWNEHLRPDFRIIVINNGGGGIFRILPGSKENSGFEQFFETPHRARFDLLCEAHGLEHMGAADSGSLRTALNAFFETGDRPKLLEIKTPRTLNDKILLQYFEFISSRLYT